MLSSLFDRITRLSLRLNWVTILFSIVMLVLGAFALGGLNQELVPRVEFPQTFVIAQWGDADSPETFLENVTIPLENALQEIDGVVNVESTTNQTFGFITVRNEFGLDQQRITASIEAAVDSAELPAGVEPDVLSFSLSDLPIVTASITSGELTLEELRVRVEEEIVPELEAYEEIARVTVAGGQELPADLVAAAAAGEEAPADAAEEPAPTDGEPIEEPAPADEDAAPADDPARLPGIVVQFLGQSGVEIESAADISVAQVQLLTGLGKVGLEALSLLPDGNLLALQPEVIAWLPTPFVDTLDADLRAALDDLAAEFGGAGALFAAEEAAEAASPADETTEPAELPQVTPQPLPDAWVTALAESGAEVTDTAGVTPALAGGILAAAPELLAELAPAQWRALPPETLALLQPAFAELEAPLPGQLDALIAAANGVPPEPLPLPDELIAAAAQTGQTLETTADLTPDLLELFLQFAPDQLEAIPAELWVAVSPDALALLPESYTSTLDEGLQQTISNVLIYDRLAELAGPAPELTVPVPVQFAPQDLPQAWIDAAAQGGVDVATTADVTPAFMQGIVANAPELLGALSPEQWRALSPDAAAVALPAVGETIDETLLVQLNAIQNAASGLLPEPQPLGDEIIEAAAAAGQSLETTADVTPDLLELFVSFAPDQLDAIPQESWIFFSADALAVLPESYVESLDPQWQQTVTNIRLANEAYLAAFDAVTVPVEEPAADGESAAGEETAEAVDPLRLPELLILLSGQFADEPVTSAADVSPDLIKLIGGFGEDGILLLGLLTPDNLRALPAEAIGFLPQAFLETVDPDLRAELDQLAAAVGGAGELARLEEERIAAQSADAPALSGIWVVPGPNGEPSQFQTAADIINNGFLPTGAAFLNAFSDPANVEDPPAWISALTPEVLQWLADNEDGFVENLIPSVLELMNGEALTYLLDTYPDTFDAALTERLRGIAAGEVEVFIPESAITRTNGNPALVISVFKTGEANTVVVAEETFTVLDSYAGDPELEYQVVFEQASFIEEAIEGVLGEAINGGIFAVLVILLFLSGRVRGRYRLSLRAVFIVGISIPASVLTAILLMRWLPSLVGVPLNDLANSSGNAVLRFISQLFPTEFTLNILTLSGLTVAIGRVVDDSIVVLENSYRYIQQGMAPREAAVVATKEVAIAIFAATLATMCVFLPLGLVGGLISSFFLPFGLTVAYALAASFGVSIILVPVLIVLFINQDNIPEHRDDTVMLRLYTPVLEWCLNHRLVTIGITLVIFVGSLLLLSRLPQSFLPELGEPSINAVIELPPGTGMAETDLLVRDFEESVLGVEGVVTVQTEVGGTGGVESFFGGGGVAQNQANLIVTVEERFITEQESLGSLTAVIRGQAEEQFGAEAVTVSAGTIASFGNAMQLILTGLPETLTLEEEAALVADVKEVIGEVDLDGNGNPDVVNIVSNIDAVTTGDAVSIIRIDGRPAISFTGEYEFGTSNTIGVVNEAKLRIAELGSLPAGAEITEGFDSEQQSQGFQGIITAIGWASILVYLVMALSFRSLVHPFTILFSLPLSLIGAAIALTLTDRVLGISSMIGLLMLVGIVTTNGIVLMEFVKQLREDRGMKTYEALVEGGRTRLRPIWMTALATILALVPLALSSEAGAIIAADLAWTVLGGMLVGTLLTLVIIPVVYSLLDQGIDRLKGMMSRSAPAGAAGD